MKRAILLAGVPGTGKTTIARNLMEQFGGLGAFDMVEPEKLVTVMRSGDIDIVGNYSNPDEVFAGTDKLSMAVQPAFVKYVQENSPTMFIEGDRLVGNKTIDFLLREGYDIRVIVLTVDPKEIQRRYGERGSDQSETFLKSKATKVSNISGRLDLMMDGTLIEEKNQELADSAAIAGRMFSFLKAGEYA